MKYLYTPRDIAVFFRVSNFKRSEEYAVLNDLLGNHKDLIQPEYEDDKELFRRRIDFELSKIDGTVDDELKCLMRDTGNPLNLDDAEEQGVIESYFKNIKLGLAYGTNKVYRTITLRKLLEQFGYKRRSAKLVTYIRRTMDALGLETYSDIHTLCDIAAFAIDDRVIIRHKTNKTLENKQPDPPQTRLSVELLEKAIDEAFPGLMLSVRDANLPDFIYDAYTPGMIIKELGFCDASNRVTGMITTHRYTILSNHMMDYGSEIGFQVADRGSYFKVLGTHEHNGKKLIALLHLPNDTWKMFQNTTSNIEDGLLDKAVKMFVSTCDLEPVPELTTETWLKRCHFPLGIDTNGYFVEVE